MLLNALQELQKRVRTLEQGGFADAEELAELRRAIEAIGKETTKTSTKLGIYAAIAAAAVGALVSYAVTVYSAPAPPPPPQTHSTDRK